MGLTTDHLNMFAPQPLRICQRVKLTTVTVTTEFVVKLVDLYLYQYQKHNKNPKKSNTKNIKLK